MREKITRIVSNKKNNHKENGKEKKKVCEKEQDPSNDGNRCR